MSDFNPSDLIKAKVRLEDLGSAHEDLSRMIVKHDVFYSNQLRDLYDIQSSLTNQIKLEKNLIKKLEQDQREWEQGDVTKFVSVPIRVSA